MDKQRLKKILFIALLVLFVPFAIFTLVTGKLAWFFGGALAVYLLIQLANKFLKE
jgi:hypothetical protein